MVYRENWYLNNKEKAYAASRAWRMKNKEKMREYYREYYKKHREQYIETEQRRYKKHRVKRLAAARDRAKKRRLVIINAYGGKCACCGESASEFLSIDHVNGGGYKERKSRGMHSFYLSIIKRNFPKDYRILCHNCNQALGFYGYCPHNKKEEI